VSARFSDFIYSFQTVLCSVVFSLTTAPLTGDSFSLSSSCHVHKVPHFWRLADGNLTSEILALVGSLAAMPPSILPHFS